MAGESTKEVGESLISTVDENKKSKKKKGLLSRLWGAVFRVHGDDFEKRLQHISKEEAAVVRRISRRSQNSLRMTRHVIIFSVLFEVIAVAYAIVTTRSLSLNWKMRALRVLPMFLFPALAFITCSALRSFTRMRDQKDKKILERLRAERQVKIDELKERTNYYITQQLIQRYDPDPAAKAAAATVLASKLGADSGLRMYVEDEAKSNASDVEISRNTGLRNRKSSNPKTSSAEIVPSRQPEEPISAELEGADVSQQRQMVVEHYPQTGFTTRDGGWIARFAALLVGEDPTQSYALICGNCHMHNGLARKEDFLHITYYCPQCKALNRPKQPGEQISGSDSPPVTSLTPVEVAEIESDAKGFGVPTPANNTLIATAPTDSEG